MRWFEVGARGQDGQEEDRRRTGGQAEGGSFAGVDIQGGFLLCVESADTLAIQ